VHTPEIRPHFTLYVETSASQALGCIQQHLTHDDCSCRGWVTVPYAELRVEKDDRHFWSPRLAVYVEDTPGGAHLHCRLQPEPDVWTLFLAGYALSAIGLITGMFFGYSQWVLDSTPWAAYVGIPISLVVGIGLYFGALGGQTLGHDQMGQLRRELETSLEEFGVKYVETT
jgi:hypothetical protein